MNKTKVFPARVFGKTKNGREVEILFLGEVNPKKWEVLIRGKTKVNDSIKIGKMIGVIKRNDNKIIIKLNVSKKILLAYLEKKGHVPLPPYIKRSDNFRDRNNYQTVFATKVGSAAAPTAGLHFTNRLIKNLKKQGVSVEYITLHVGLGTFAPIKNDLVEDHHIHEEIYEISQKTAENINRAKKEGQRIIACGTTVVRALESSAKDKKIIPQKSKTKLFITPGYKFRIVDGLITNFHTPRSSLLCLVYALAGQENIRNIYRVAIDKKYKLFSYGDGMLIL